MTTVLLAVRSDHLDEQVRTVQQLLPAARVVLTQDRTEMEALIDDVEVAAGGVPIALILRAPRLRWYQQWGAGADWLMRHPEAAGRPFVLTNASGVHAIPISEHILALMLAFARGLPESMRGQAQGQWLAHGQRPQTFELAGKTLLLIGVGAIGRRTATLCSALGMRVLGVRRQGGEHPVPGIELMASPQDLPRLLPQADFVVLTVPLTSETQGMIGERELSLMKGHSILINIGRGGTVNEEALLSALRERRIGGAGLDVFQTEPLPASSPLWQLDNVIITAHYSGSTPHYDERAMAIFLDNLRRYVAGQPLRNVVDKRAGY